MKEVSDRADTLASAASGAVSGPEPRIAEACLEAGAATDQLRESAGATAPTSNQHPDYPDYFAALYQRSGGEKLGLAFPAFARILDEVATKYLPAPTGEDIGEDIGEDTHKEPGEDIHKEQAEALLGSLHLEELALARACAQGSEPAWEIFLNRYREKLYDAGEAIARDESVGRELADGLYADLFGTRQGLGGGRISKLDSYTGRGSLEGWLRTVLAQEYVNRYRSQRRLVSLEEQVEAGAQFRAKEADAAPPDARLPAATDEALSSLSAEERFILAFYYLDGRTLAEIAGTLGVHESTVSRRVEKITKGLRKRIVRGLRDRGMSAHEAEQALEADVRDVVLDVRGRLVQEKDG
ncbi:MAG TPA: sigma-70 family RNA polymerase sigma factor [Terriglobia bacterium]|nr:sigma-70 family RNA polymerase sigma factor [Terriglobia bacterium]